MRTGRIEWLCREARVTYHGRKQAQRRGIDIGDEVLRKLEGLGALFGERPQRLALGGVQYVVAVKNGEPAVVTVWKKERSNRRRKP